MDFTSLSFLQAQVPRSIKHFRLLQLETFNPQTHSEINKPLAPNHNSSRSLRDTGRTHMAASSLFNEPQPAELPAWFTSDSDQPRGDGPFIFKQLPFEIQDLILTRVLCDFPRPETSDPANDGRYIGEHSRLAEMPWEIDTRALRHPDPAVRARARRVMMVTNQFVYIKSESVNLLPLFHAAQVPIAALGVGKWARSRIEELSEFFILTHQIERVGGIGSSITSTANPWGRTRESLQKLSLVGRHVPPVQEFVILRRDLALFCRALDGADSGYHHFGECSTHTLTVHGPFDDIMTENIPILDPSNFLQPYKEILRGFENFTIQGRIRWHTARTIEKKVQGPPATPQPEQIIEDVIRQMGQADEEKAKRPIQAAHTYAKASQGLETLYSKGILHEEGCRAALPRLAELFLLLDMRQADAWLAVLQNRHDAAQGAARKGAEDDAQGRGAQAELDRGDPEDYSSLVDLVYDAVYHAAPALLRHKGSVHQTAVQVYQTAKADRLGGRGSMTTWENINSALRDAPEDDEIRREAELIEKHMSAWTLRWTQE